jgi:hypothetical protein
MAKFYFLLWLRWASILTIKSVLLGAALAILILFALYIKQDMPSLNQEIVTALWDLFVFSFAFTWSFAFLLLLFRRLKFIFNTCINGYQLELLSCKENEKIEPIGYGDMLKVWRKWLMLLIWLVGACMIIAIIFTTLFTSHDGIFEWFSIYWLYAFILMSAFISFVLLGSRCKKIRLTRCS